MLTQRCLTIDDYFKAASLVAGCRNDRLSYVLYYLEQGGMSVPKAFELTAKCETLGVPDPNAPVMARECLVNFKAKYGMTYEKIGKILGLTRQHVYMYINEKRKLLPARAEMIIQRLADAEAQLEEQAKV